MESKLSFEKIREELSHLQRMVRKENPDSYANWVNQFHDLIEEVGLPVEKVVQASHDLFTVNGGTMTFKCSRGRLRASPHGFAREMSVELLDIIVAALKL